MGIMTISVDDAVEKRFRKTVKEYVGSGKGTIGKAASDAFETWMEQKRRHKIGQQSVALLGKFNMGNWKPVSRAELHERH